MMMMIISSWWWLYLLDDDYITCKEVLSGSGEEFVELKAPSRCRRACLSIIQSSSCLGWWWWWWWYWRLSWQLWSHRGLGKYLHFTSRSRGELSPSPTLRRFLSIAKKDGKSTSSWNIFQASLKRSDSFANTEFCNQTSKAQGEIQRLHKHILVIRNPIIYHLDKFYEYYLLYIFIHNTNYIFANRLQSCKIIVLPVWRWTRILPPLLPGDPLKTYIPWWWWW